MNKLDEFGIKIEEEKLSYYINSTKDGFEVKYGGIVIAGPYIYRETAWKEMKRLELTDNL